MIQVKLTESAVDASSVMIVQKQVQCSNAVQLNLASLICFPTAFHWINEKLCGAILKPQNKKFYFLVSDIFLKGELGTRDLISVGL